MEDQVLMMLRGQVGAIVLGTVFLLIGLAACAIAAIHGRGGVRPLIWQGIFSAMYGTRILAESPAGITIFPQLVWAARDELVWVITYLLILPALLFWMEISLGKLRRVLQIALVLALLIGIVGVFSSLIAHSPDRFLPYNNLLGISVLLVLAVVIAVPSLARRFLSVPSRILAIGTVVFAAAALHSNLKHFLDLPSLPALEPLAFAVFILSLGYVAAEKIFAGERRLLSMESELAVAREIQHSILPGSVPELKNLRITAAYLPMTAVAGDFYEFIQVDQNRVGFLIADVSGHGVPAALIASMVKVAMRSLLSSAHNPPEVLRGMNRILFGQMQEQFVSAAYLWLDMENRKASYSAAGHPPLLLWREHKLEPIESNGILLGVIPDPDFPVRDMPIKPGDRFLLYTDGAIEPENAKGDSFGGHKLEQVLSDNQSRSPSELSDQLLSEIRQWRPASTTQQDDITLIIIDVV